MTNEENTDINSADTDDTEGHLRARVEPADSEGDDTEGHLRARVEPADSEGDDTEGHLKY